MSNTIFKKEFKSPAFNKREILRYMGIKESSAEFDFLMEDCLKECSSLFKYHVCYSISDIIEYNNHISIHTINLTSKSLSRSLTECNKAIIFAATIGLGIDRLIAKYGRLSPSKALCMQAIGAERIESLCNCFCDFLNAEFGEITKRFSPGYGDLSLHAQNYIINYLDCPRQIGLTLNDSLIMSPTKSVTAIVGLKRKE